THPDHFRRGGGPAPPAVHDHPNPMTEVRLMPAVAIVLVSLAAGCVLASVGGGRVESHTGIIQIVGSAPVNVQIVLQPEARIAMRVVGDLEDEVANLGTARVTVRGRVSRSPDPIVEREIEATG